jgi:DNA polymerase
LSDALQKQVADGCIHDVELTWQLFQILGKQFPVEEFEVIDETIKMFTEPCLQGDLNLLADVWEKEERAKSKRLIDLNVSEEQLQSADKFAELLRAEGVEPDVKDGKKGPIYAFAKTDQFMRDLMEDENDRVRGLAEARLGVKSTLLQTRAETLGWMASRGSGGSPSPMPVYLRYAGTGTLRVSGGDGANWTNFKRNSYILKAVMAPDGYFLGPADASLIECRVCHYMAGGADEPVIQLFRNGEDPYVGLASKFYGETIYKPKKDDPREHEMSIKRGMGKQGRLMCQYGSAGPKFKATAKAGLYGPSVEISIEDAVNFVQLYRSDNPSICDSSSGYWAQCNRMMLSLYQGDYVDWGPLQVKEHKIFLPNGTYLNYESLEWHRPEPDEPHLKSFELSGYWRMKTRYGWKKMWGAKMTQNICEAVSRVIVSQAMIRIRRKGIRTLNWPYDELLLLIPDDKFAAERLEECRQEMIRPVRWLPGLPLDAEASLGKRYSK